MTVNLILNNQPYSFRATNAEEVADNLIWCFKDAGAPVGMFSQVYEYVLQTLLETEGHL